MLHDDNYLALRLEAGVPAGELIGQTIAEYSWPDEVLVSLINRGGRIFPPRGSTQLRAHDRLTLIGSTEGIAEVRERFQG